MSLTPHANARHRLESFRDEISVVYPELVSLIAYGSAVGEHFQDKVSDVNLILVLPKVDAEVLERGAEVLRRHWQKSRILPVLFSEQELRDSLDVFAVEFSDIRERHLVLKGMDIFESVMIPGTWLRHQCEFELRTKMLALRQGFLECHGRDKELGALMVRVYSGVLPLGRSMLRLGGEVPPHSPIDLIEALARRYQFPVQPWLEVLALKQGHRGEAARPAAALYREFLGSLDAVVKRVNDAL